MVASGLGLDRQGSPTAIQRKEGEDPTRSMPNTNGKPSSRLLLVIVGNALMRTSSGASGVLVGLYLANLANRGSNVNAALVGTLGAASFGAELIGALPMGLASDALAPRALMIGGAVLGALATQLFGLTSRQGIFFLSRGAEGLSAAATTPSLLAHLTDASDRNHALRARVMSYFELSLLAGLALGGLVGAQLWRFLDARAFSAVAVLYVLAAGLLSFGAAGSRSHGSKEAISGFYRALREPSLRCLAPVWLCVNTIVGLWLGPTFIFLLTRRSQTHQFLDGALADHPDRVGWVLLGYAIVFATGVSGWSIVLPRMSEQHALRIALVAMLTVCIGLLLLNHSGGQSPLLRWTLATLSTMCVMVESGFTPAALSLLAGAIGAQAGRGAAMGIYSVLLSIGAIAGSFLAAALGQALAVDGLIYGTLAMAVVAFIFVRSIGRSTSHLERRTNVTATV
jgi:MFS family permease